MPWWVDYFDERYLDVFSASFTPEHNAAEARAVAGFLSLPSGAEVLDLLFGLADESRKTLVIVTHDEHLARRGDRIITIMDGQAV